MRQYLKPLTLVLSLALLGALAVCAAAQEPGGISIPKDMPEPKYPSGARAERKTDDGGTVVSEQDAKGTIREETTYDPQGRVVKKVTNDEKGNKTEEKTTTYHGDTKTPKSEDTTQYRHDENTGKDVPKGNVRVEKDEKGNRTSWTSSWDYDSKGHPRRVIHKEHDPGKLEPKRETSSTIKYDYGKNEASITSTIKERGKKEETKRDTMPIVFTLRPSRLGVPGITVKPGEVSPGAPKVTKPALPVAPRTVVTPPAVPKEGVTPTPAKPAALVAPTKPVEPGKPVVTPGKPQIPEVAPVKKAAPVITPQAVTPTPRAVVQPTPPPPPPTRAVVQPTPQVTPRVAPIPPPTPPPVPKAPLPKVTLPGPKVEPKLPPPPPPPPGPPPILR